MLKVLGPRLVRLVATLFAVSVLTFFMTKLLPGDPVNAILPPESARDQATVDRITEELGLNDPVYVQYANWLGNALTGDLGKSYVTDQPVIDAIKDRVPVTFELALLATIFALIIAVPVGTIGAYREGRRIDKITSAGVQTALSVPNFIVGIMLIWLLTVKFRLLPSTGWNRISGPKGIFENFRSALLPSIALCLTPMAFYARLIRADMIGTLKENYVLSARAKGLKDWYVLLRHALRPSSMSLVTIIGIQFGVLLGGTVVIESLFALPGLGARLIAAINQRDVLMVQGITLFIATAYVVINTAVDMLYLFIDPRIRKA
jgi:peptide/nickel transport system permease protein